MEQQNKDGRNLPTVSETPQSEMSLALAAQGPAPEVGKRFGPYLIIRLLGKGGMGEVYEAENEETGRRVALKVLSHQVGDPADQRRFLREGRLAASINHPNSVYIFGTETIEGTHVIAMEFIPGGTLKDRVKEKGPMAVTEAVDAILQVISGLEAAQGAGILHRDIKPANCFVQADGTVKIGDFGLSISTLRKEESQLTKTGSFLGTPAFASPEQLRADDLDVRSDIYSVGATLYFLLAGKPPFSEPNLMKLLTEIAQKPPQAPSKLRPEIAKGLSEIILRCLQKEPAKRFPDYTRLKQALIPFSSVASMPVGLFIRFWAGLIDWTLLTAIGMLASLTFSRHVLFTLYLTITIAALNIIYSGILEGVWGTSVGKIMCGIRVVAEDRSVPGPARALLRSSIYSVIWWISNISVFLLLPAGFFYTPNALVAAIPYGIGAFWLLNFLTVHPDNRRAGVHELLSGTRMALKLHYKLRAVARQKEEARSIPASVEEIGPYAVIRVLRQTGVGTLQLGHDTQLRRNVWIHVYPNVSPAVSETRRDLSRPTRLRWLNGKRAATESWDAYEAPDGRAFLDVLGKKHSWGVVRHWLHDLAEELDAALKDGSIPPTVGFDQIWITDAGRVKLVDFPVPAAGQLESTAIPRLETRDFASSQAFLGQTAASALQGVILKRSPSEWPAPKVPLPLYARSFLENLNQGCFDTFESLLNDLRALLRAEPAVSRRIRVAQIGCYCLLPILYVLVFLVLNRTSTAAIIGILGRSSIIRLAKETLNAANAALALLSYAAVGTALASRGGLILHLTGVAVVAADGTRISRIRALLRSVLAWWLPWLPTFFLAYVLGAAPFSANVHVPRSGIVTPAMIPGVLIICILAGGAAWSIASPMRSPADRIAGTFLVPGRPLAELRTAAASGGRPNRRRKLAQWALALELGISLGLGAILLYVQHGNRLLLQKEIERLEAAGEPTDYIQWMTPTAPIDEALQERFWKWQLAWALEERWNPLWSRFPTELMPWLVGQDSAPPPELLALMSQEKSKLKELEDFLSQDRLINGSPGWFGRDRADGKRIRTFRTPFSIRRSVCLLGYASMLERYPDSKLEVLEKLLAKGTPTRSIYDKGIGSEGTAVRDEMYLLLAIQNRLPVQFEAAWLAQSTPFFDWAADAERSDYLREMQLFLDEDLGAMRVYFQEVPAGDSAGPFKSGFLWWLLLNEPALLSSHVRHSAEIASWIRQRERIVRSDKTPFFLPGLEQALAYACESHNIERLKHLAVETIRIARSRRSLPDHERELLRWVRDPQVLASGVDRFQLRYEKLGINRFRVSIDPVSPIPAYYSVKRKALRVDQAGLETHFGEPRSEPFWKNNNPYSLEIELSGPHLE